MLGSVFKKKLYFCTILLTIYKSCGSKCCLQTLAFTNFYWHHGTDNWKQKLNFCFFNFLNLTIFDLVLKRAWKISCRVIQKGSHSQNDNFWPILPHVTHCCFFSEIFYFMPSTKKWQNMKWKRRIFSHKWLLVKHVMLYQKTKKGEKLQFLDQLILPFSHLEAHLLSRWQYNCLRDKDKLLYPLLVFLFVILSDPLEIQRRKTELQKYR